MHPLNIVWYNSMNTINLHTMMYKTLSKPFYTFYIRQIKIVTCSLKVECYKTSNQLMEFWFNS